MKQTTRNTRTAQPHSMLGKVRGSLQFRIRGKNLAPQSVKLNSQKCLIGSGPSCTLRLQAEGVQEAHCLVLSGRNGLAVRCLCPDTLLNGRTFEDASLEYGDRLRLGPLELEVLTSGKALSNSERLDQLLRKRDREIISLRSEMQRQQGSIHRMMDFLLDEHSRQSALADTVASLELNQEECTSGRLTDHTSPEPDILPDERLEALEQIEQREAQCHRQLEDIEAQQQRLQCEQSELQRDRRVLGETTRALKEERSLLAAQRESLEATRRELESARSELADNETASTTTDIRLEDLEARQQQIDREQEAIDQQRQALAETTTSLKEERERLATERQALDTTRQEIKSAQAVLANIEEREFESELQLDEINKQRQELEQSQALLSQQQKDLAEANDTLEQQQKELARERESLKETRQEIENARTALDEAQEDNGKSEKALENIESRRIQLEEELEQLHQKHTALDERAAELNRDKEALEGQRESLDNDRKLIVSQQEEMRRERTLLNEEWEVLHNENKDLESKKLAAEASQVHDDTPVQEMRDTLGQASPKVADGLATGEVEPVPEEGDNNTLLDQLRQQYQNDNPEDDDPVADDTHTSGQDISLQAQSDTPEAVESSPGTNSHVPSTPDEESEVADYLSNMLNRIRSQSETMNASQAQCTTRPPQQEATAQMSHQAELANEVPVSEQPTEEPPAEPCPVYEAKKQEVTDKTVHSLSSLRNLANETARNAVGRHTAIAMGKNASSKLQIAGIALICAMAMGILFQGNAYGYAAIGTMLVVVVWWSFQAWRFQRIANRHQLSLDSTEKVTVPPRPQTEGTPTENAPQTQNEETPQEEAADTITESAVETSEAEKAESTASAEV